MAAEELLNSEVHASLRVRAASAAGRHFVQVVPAEFARIACRCPILLTKNADTGRFYAGAVMGFVAGENLLIDATGRFDGYLPLEIEREGFSVSASNIAIDREHRRFGADATAALFEADGGAGDALKRVQRALAGLKAGLDESERFVAALIAHGLVEPIDVSLTFDDGERIVLEGLYTVSKDALSDVEDGVVLALFGGGHLTLAHMMIDSLNQIALLARRRNDRLTGDRLSGSA